MKYDKICGILWLVIGSALAALGYADTLDEFWCGMGTTLVLMGILRLLRAFRLNRNEAYREQKALEATDERLHYIRMKAWSWAGYLFVIITGLGTIALNLLGQDDFATAAGGAVCLVITLYWLSFFVLKKKY